MSTGVPLPVPKARFFDANGDPLVGGKLYSYQAGTLVALDTYSDQALSVPNTNPIILDGRGEATVFIPDGTLYKFILKDSSDVQQWAVDNVEVVAPAAPVVPSPVPTGGIMAYGAAAAPSGFLLCDGSAVSRATYATLFGVVGTTYGAGDGSTTFNIPDLRGKFPFGKATAGTGNALGASFGNIDHTHTGPSHTHDTVVPRETWGTQANAPGVSGRLVVGNGAGGADQPTGDKTITSTSSGTGNTSAANPPALTVNYIIKT